MEKERKTGLFFVRLKENEKKLGDKNERKKAPGLIEILNFVSLLVSHCFSELVFTVILNFLFLCWFYCLM